MGVAKNSDSNTPCTQCAIVDFVFKLGDCCGPAASVQPCNGESGVNSEIGAGRLASIGQFPTARICEES